MYDSPLLPPESNPFTALRGVLMTLGYLSDADSKYVGFGCYIGAPKPTLIKTQR